MPIIIIIGLLLVAIPFIIILKKPLPKTPKQENNIKMNETKNNNEMSNTAKFLIWVIISAIIGIGLYQILKQICINEIKKDLITYAAFKILSEEKQNSLIRDEIMNQFIFFYMIYTIISFIILCVTFKKDNTKSEFTFDPITGEDIKKQNNNYVYDPYTGKKLKDYIYDPYTGKKIDPP